MEEIPKNPKGRKVISSKATDQVVQPSGARFNSYEKQEIVKHISGNSTATDEKSVDFSIKLLSARVNACCKLIVLTTITVVFIGWTAFALYEWANTGSLLPLAFDTGPAALFAKVTQHILFQ